MTENSPCNKFNLVGGVMSLWAAKEIVQTLVMYKVGISLFTCFLNVCRFTLCIFIILLVFYVIDIIDVIYFYPPNLGYGCWSASFGFDWDQHEWRAGRTDEDIRMAWKASFRQAPHQDRDCPVRCLCIVVTSCFLAFASILFVGYWVA